MDGFACARDTCAGNVCLNYADCLNPANKLRRAVAGKKRWSDLLNAYVDVPA